MKKNNILIMISAAALLSSCGIYNKYERPEVNTTGLVRDVASATDTRRKRHYELRQPALAQRVH